MNPGSFFREVLESHEFRSSDMRDADSRGFLPWLGAYSIMSDNVNLLDMTLTNKLRRFMRYCVEISAA